MKLIELIKNRDFKSARKEVKLNSFLVLKNELEKEAFINPDIQIYNFIVSLINENPDNKEYNEFASELMATALNHFENGYKIAFKHAKEVVRIDPNSLENWEWLLFFYNIPEKLLSKEELKEVLIKIFKINKVDKKALDLLKSEFNEIEILEIQSKVQDK